MTDVMQELKPCPWCQSKELSICEPDTDYPQHRTAHVDCDNCWASGPECKTRQEAYTAWNNRPHPEPVAWMPIESAPKNDAGEFLGPTILIYYQADGLPWPAYWGPLEDSRIDGTWMCADDDARAFHTPDVTHWMPLPAAPGGTTTTSAVGELVEGLQEALAWHEGELKALSKQPPSPSLEWPKHQHRERIDALSDLLAKHGGAK